MSYFTQLFSSIYDKNNLWLYAVDYSSSGSEIFRVTDDGISLGLESIGTVSSCPHFSWVAWEDKIYFVSETETLKRIRYKSLTQVNTDDLEPEAEGYVKRNVKAKYLCNAENHLMLGNLNSNGTKMPLRIIWSDLQDPDNFIQSSATEGGYFDFSASDVEIMGMVYQRGFTNIFTYNSVWAAQYVGYDAGIFEFSAVSNSIGCGYHFSLVQTKDITFFAGKDNFYVLDGNSVEPIGTSIWEGFQKVLEEDTTELIGFKDDDTSSVGWWFTANGEMGTTSGERYALMYNYRDQVWFMMSSYGAFDFWQTKVNLQTCITCDEITAPMSSFPDTFLCSDFVKDFDVKILFAAGAQFLIPTGTSSNQSVWMESKDFTFSKFDDKVNIETLRLVCSHVNMLGAAATASGSEITLSLGYRENLGSDITWTPEVKVASELNDERDILFQFRKHLVSGKYFRFRLSATGLGVSYLRKIFYLQFNLNICSDGYNSTR